MEANVCECRFCGSQMIIESTSPLLPEECDQYAVRQCPCGGASRHRRIGRGLETIDVLAQNDEDGFDLVPDAVIMLLKHMVEPIIDGEVTGCTIEAGSEKIGLGEKNGDVWMKRKKTLEIAG